MSAGQQSKHYESTSTFRSFKESQSSKNIFWGFQVFVDFDLAKNWHRIFTFDFSLQNHFFQWKKSLQSSLFLVFYSIKPIWQNILQFYNTIYNADYRVLMEWFPLFLSPLFCQVRGKLIQNDILIPLTIYKMNFFCQIKRAISEQKFNIMVHHYGLDFKWLLKLMSLRLDSWEMLETFGVGPN